MDSPTSSPSPTFTPNPSKPWKVDYAKTSRSSCKTCKAAIPKGTLRIAKMVPARQFEGLMPMWNHAECVLKHRGQFQKIDDLEGFEALQSEDQEKIKKYLHDLGDKSVPAVFEETDIDGIEDSFIEKAKSSRSTCKSCNQKIPKGEIRISTTADSENPWFRGTMVAWRHVKCFMEIGWWTSPMEKMSGWDKLSDEDKQVVKTIAEQHLEKGTRDKKHALKEDQTVSSNDYPNKKIKTSEAAEDSGDKIEKTTKLEGLVGNALGFLKTLVADIFGRIPLQSTEPEDMKDIPDDITDTVKYLRKAKSQLDHLQARNKELEGTNALAKIKLEKEFASVKLLAADKKELDTFADDERPFMEVIHKACLYKQMQESK